MKNRIKFNNTYMFISTRTDNGSFIKLKIHKYFRLM